MPEKILYTIGYGNGTPETLVARLKAAGIKRVVDVRARPHSNPKRGFTPFNLQAIFWNEWFHIEYGGRLFGNHDRESPPFDKLRSRVRAFFEKNGPDPWLFQRIPTALLCSEGKPFDEDGNCRCHRVVVAEEIARVHGMEVKHLWP